MPNTPIPKHSSNKRSIISWCLFDWAHSSFPTVITTFVFSTYFMKEVAQSTIDGTEYWSWALAAAGISVAILAPIFGACADQMGRKKPWLFLFSCILTVSICMLFFTQPNPHWIVWALVWFAIADIAFELAQVFYNSLLINITTKDTFGRISGWGWGTGYFGGLICLVITLYVFIQGGFISTDNSLNTRAVTLFVAAWFALFAIPIFLFTKDNKPTSVPISKAIKNGMHGLAKSLRNIRKKPVLLRYLIAHLIYMDGLNTLFAFGGIFAAGTFHMKFSDILLWGIAINVAAGIGAVGFAWVDDWLGSKFTICVSILALLIVSITIMLTHSITVFWICGIVIGIFAGPTQSASRSYLAHIVEPEESNEVFGLYAFSGRLTAFAGPLLLGLLTVALGTQRAGVGVIVLFLLIGGIMMLRLPKTNLTK